VGNRPAHNNLGSKLEAVKKWKVKEGRQGKKNPMINLRKWRIFPAGGAADLNKGTVRWEVKKWALLRMPFGALPDPLAQTNLSFLSVPLPPCPWSLAQTTLWPNLVALLGFYLLVLSACPHWTFYLCMWHLLKLIMAPECWEPALELFVPILTHAHGWHQKELSKSLLNSDWRDPGSVTEARVLREFMTIWKYGLWQLMLSRKF
jgi:hypothetical protein